jgi:hypothetical protein
MERCHARSLPRIHFLIFVTYGMELVCFSEGLGFEHENWEAAVSGGLLDLERFG